MTDRPDNPDNPDAPDALLAAELAELEMLAATLPADEVEGVAPVQGPQDWE